MPVVNAPLLKKLRVVFCIVLEQIRGKNTALFKVAKNRSLESFAGIYPTCMLWLFLAHFDKNACVLNKYYQVVTHSYRTVILCRCILGMIDVCIFVAFAGILVKRNIS